MMAINGLVPPAVDWHCVECGKELGIGWQLGKRKSDRKTYCLKCSKKLKGNKK